MTVGASSVRPPIRPRRCCLTVPGNSSSKLARAASLQVDEAIIDLEDSVPADQKTDETRRLVVDSVSAAGWSAPVLAVRVNAIGSPWFEDDLKSMVRWVGPRLATLVLPKVESAADVLVAVAVLDQLEEEGAEAGHIGIEAQIETARGLVEVEAISGCSGRLEALIFGPGDFAASMGMPMGSIGGIDAHYPGTSGSIPAVGSP